MIKIIHLGAYSSNIGDNVALLNARKGIEKFTKQKIEWTNFDIQEFHAFANATPICINIFKNLNKNYDMMLIGGGGLVQCNSKFHNNFNLPFTEEVLWHIKIPIVSFALGFNTFRVRTDMQSQIKRTRGITSTFMDNLHHLVKKSTLFSLRNDGSIELLEEVKYEALNDPNSSLSQIAQSKDMNNSEAYQFDWSSICKTPDPGLIYDFQKPRVDKIDPKKGVFNNAVNRNPDLIGGRYLHGINFFLIRHLISDNNLKLFPHCNKDYDLYHHNFQKVMGTKAARATHPAWETLMNFQSLEKKLNIKKQHFDEFFYGELYSEDEYVISKKDFQKYLKLDECLNYINKYLDYDFSIAMRGHGQMIAIGVNLPSLYFVTQHKLQGFADDNGFDEFCVDIMDEDSWLSTLKEKIDLLKNDKEYLMSWYDTRDECISKNRIMFDNFCKEVSLLINDISKGRNNG